MTDRELMQQALEALEFHVKNADDIEEIDVVLVTALRERLAQPVQKPTIKQSLTVEQPVAVLVEGEPYSIDEIDWESLQEQGHTVQLLYTAPQPRQWQGLARLEFQKAVEGLEDLEDCWIAIEAKLKEKNT